MRTLVRLAERQGVVIKDLTEEMDEVKHLAQSEATRRTEARHKRRLAKERG
jgi:hypothetical protein